MRLCELFSYFVICVFCSSRRDFFGFAKNWSGNKSSGSQFKKIIESVLLENATWFSPFSNNYRTISAEHNQKYRHGFKMIPNSRWTQRKSRKNLFINSTQLRFYRLQYICYPEKSLCHYYGHVTQWDLKSILFSFISLLLVRELLNGFFSSSVNHNR